MRRYGIPLLTLLLGYLVYYLARLYVPGSFKSEVLCILQALALFAFGASMSTHNRKSSTWVKKTAIIVAMVFLIAGQLHLLEISEINIIFAKLGPNSFLFCMLYTYFGFIFF